MPFSVRPVVAGEGRAERIRVERTASPLDVKVANLSEVTGPLAAIAETLNKLFEKHVAAAAGGAPPEGHDAANASQAPDAGEPSRALAKTAGPKAKRRGQWPVTRTQPEVARYLSERQGQYNDLVPKCLAREPGAKKKFQDVFGPSAIAGAIGDRCEKQNVEKTDTYEKRIKPVFSGQAPEGWRPPKQHDAELDDDISRMHREAGRG